MKVKILEVLVALMLLGSFLVMAYFIISVIIVQLGYILNVVF